MVIVIRDKKKFFLGVDDFDSRVRDVGRFVKRVTICENE